MKKWMLFGIGKGSNMHVMRDSIHCHGLAKLKDDSRLCKLNEVPLNGHNVQQMFSSNNFELQQFDKLERAVHEGKVAEAEICNYFDSIVTAEGPSPPCEGKLVKLDIHTCKKKRLD